MNPRKKLNQVRLQRTRRTRARILGNTARPRLSVFRSNKSMYAQLIDDHSGRTLVSASSKEIKTKQVKLKASEAVGKLLAEKAVKVGIKQVVFDRGKYAFHGRVKAVAEAARAGGLSF